MIFQCLELELESELELQRRQFEAEIAELTSKLEDEKKIRSMLILRVQDEKRARYIKTAMQFFS